MHTLSLRSIQSSYIKNGSNKGGASHNTGYKTRARSNRLGQSCGIKEAGIEKRMRRLIAN